MTDELPPVPAPLKFRYREDELAAYGRHHAARNEPDSNYTFWAAVVGAIPAIGLVVLLANHLALISAAQLPPVLFTAYLAFFAGAFAFYGMWLLRCRQAARTSALEAKDVEWEAAFDDGGITWKNPKGESRVPWRAVEAVVEAGLLVTIWVTRDSGMPIPVRLFPDATVRAAFITATRERAAAAQAPASSESRQS